MSKYQCSICELHLINSDVLCTTVVLYFLLGQLYSVVSVSGTKYALIKVKSRVLKFFFSISFFLFMHLYHRCVSIKGFV